MILRLLRKTARKCLEGVFFLFPVKRNKVLFINFNGKGFGCNPKYIALELLEQKLEELVLEGKRRVTYQIPNRDAGALNTLYRFATVEDVEYGAEYITVIAMADAKARGMMRQYAVDDSPEQEDEE